MAQDFETTPITNEQADQFVSTVGSMVGYTPDMDNPDLSFDVSVLDTRDGGALTSMERSMKAAPYMVHLAVRFSDAPEPAEVDPNGMNMLVAVVQLESPATKDGEDVQKKTVETFAVEKTDFLTGPPEGFEDLELVVRYDERQYQLGEGETEWSLVPSVMTQKRVELRKMREAGEISYEEFSAEIMKMHEENAEFEAVMGVDTSTLTQARFERVMGILARAE